jgi:cholesterol 7-dehydrogenase
MPHPALIARESVPDFPAAWYTVGTSTGLGRGELQAFSLCGIDLVLYRTASGRFCVIENRCPHMGSLFSTGGRVVGEELECPLHRFRFDTDGTCTATGYDGVAPPRKACATPWQVDEVNDLLLVWYHPDGELPTWRVPAEQRDGWTGHTVKTYDIQAPVMLVAEGIADKGHLSTVHGYHEVSMDSDFVADDHRLSVTYSFSNSRSVLGEGWLGRLVERLVDNRIKVSFDYVAHGLGYAHTELYIPRFNLRTRHLVNPTPLGNGRTRLFVTMAIQHLPEPGRISPLLAILPEAWSRRLMFGFLWHGYLHDLHDDIHMWEHMAPLQTPALSAGDGPVARFRRWAKQFAPTPLLDQSLRQ